MRAANGETERMNSRFCSVLLLLCVALGALAPYAPARAQGVARAAPIVPEVDDAGLPTLALPSAGAISLRASLAGLRANPGADADIKSWVARGNVVFLHTDAARSFGFATAPLRATTPAQDGQEWVRTRAALPLGAHPLLRGETGAEVTASPLAEAFEMALPAQGVARLPGVSLVFGSLREGDALVEASDVATPLLLVEDVTGDGQTPQFAAAITSLGAGWAIFCPDQIDLRRADGAAFARALAGFVPGATGQRWVGIPTRSLQEGTQATLAAALEARLLAANATNGTAALPAFGVPTAPVTAPPVSEPTLPVSREEAAALLATIRAGDASAPARIALFQARLALQNADPATCARALEAASADPSQASQVAFSNGCLNAQLAADASLAAPERANLFDLAARTIAASIVTRAPAEPGVPGSLRRAWSQKLARLAAISSLSPPLVRTLAVGDATASIRFFEGDPNEAALETSVTALLSDTAFGWRAPHVEVMLLPTPESFFALRRALGGTGGGGVAGGAHIGDTILLASGASDDATLRALWSRVLLATWSDDTSPLPAWVEEGFVGVALGGNSPDARAALRNAAQAGALSLFENEARTGNSPLGRARSTALVAWLYSQFGAGTASELVARLASGQAPDAAIGAATGQPLDALDADWNRFLVG